MDGREKAAQKNATDYSGNKAIQSELVDQLWPENKSINAFKSYCELNGFNIFNGRKVYLFVTWAWYFDEKYKVDAENYEFLDNFVGYFLGGKTALNRRKGILLMGNTGSGKTLAFKVIQKIYEETSLDNGTRILPFEYTYAIKMSKKYVTEGINALNKATKPRSVYIDDLGEEKKETHFGSELEVIEYIIGIRYDNWQSHNHITHATTNGTTGDIQNRYGKRTVSRMKQMFNIVLLGASENYTDRREVN